MARRARRTPPPRPEQVGDDPNATLVFDAVEDSDDSGDETPDSAGQRDSNGRDPSGGGETEADARGHSPARRVRSTDRQFTDVMVDTEIAEVISEGAALSRVERRRRMALHTPERPILSEQGASFGSRKWMMQGVAAGAITLIAVGVPILGNSGGTTANASQNLTGSYVGANARQANGTTPSALTGDPSAQARSAEQAISSEAEKNPSGSLCSAEGAQGVRAAHVKDTSNTVVSPLPEGVYRLTSPFGYRVDPISGGYSEHAGQDYAAPMGTPIHAVAEGVVTHAGPGIQGRSNNLIIIQHKINGETFYTWYIHMYDNGVLVKKGDKVKAGQTIGLVGSNGNSTGPHLHLEVHSVADKLMDPVAFLKSHGAQDPTKLCN